MNVNQRVGVVDHDPEYLDSIGRLVRFAGYQVKTYQSGTAFLRGLDFENTFCAVVEVNMPDLDGLRLQQILSTRKSSPPLIFIAESATVAMGVQAMKGGAVDFLSKPLDSRRLLVAIQEAATRHQKERETTAALNQFNSLTAREREIFGLVTTGLLNKQIAAQLGIAEKTIKVHRGRVMRKMEVRSLADLVRLSERVFCKSSLTEIPNGPVPCSEKIFSHPSSENS